MRILKGRLNKNIAILHLFLTADRPDHLAFIFYRPPTSPKCHEDRMSTKRSISLAYSIDVTI